MEDETSKPKKRRHRPGHTSRIRKKQMAELRALRAEVELLHRRLAAIYDDLTLGGDDAGTDNDTANGA